VSIGKALAEARRQADLTLTQVSQQTRIRETIIRGIESDDYSACGGDFYPRGHIRSIAKVVGADPAPLIREYDSTRRAPDS
jgi:cytoskeletal protein RodZ